MRVRVAALAALAVVQTLVLVDAPAAVASQADLDRARRQANAAAADVAAAQTRLARLEAEIAGLEARRQQDEERMQALETAARDAAVQRYIRGIGRRGLPSLDPADASAATRAEALAEIVAAGADDAVDAYRAAAEDHALAGAQLAESRRSAAAAVADLRRRLRDATARLARLQALEAERIAREREQRRRAAASRPSRSAPAPSARRPRTAVVIGSGDWICPVQGPRAFTNDWGQPRSGGRRHQGTDILSPRGTPVVAPVSGVARTHNSRLGGLSFYLNGSDGNTYFGTHLNSYSGNSGRVAAGTVLGYVGNSGNARGGPTHLHFEIHPGGGGPVNPYPTLRQYC